MAPLTRRLIRLAVALVLAAGLVLLLVHTAPVRRAVLRRAIATAADRLNVDVRADALQYNLLTLDVTLTGVTVAATAASAPPFLAADRIAVSLPRSALLGRFALQRVELDNARVDIVRRADGSTNLPSGTGPSDGEPGALPLERLVIPRLAFSYTDAPNDLSLTLPQVALDLGTADGSIGLERDGSLRQAGDSTTITALDGGISFDGRTVRLADVSLAAPEGRVTASGTLALLVDTPRMDLSVSASGELARITSWGRTTPLADGNAAFDGTLAGPFTSLQLRGTATSPRITWDTFTFADLTADVEADAQRIHVPRLSTAFADGQVRGTLTRDNATGRTDATAEWSGVDTTRLTHMLTPAATVRPAARATGSASASGLGGDLRDWSIQATSRLISGAGAPRQLPVSGNVALDIDDGRWSLTTDGTAGATPLAATLRGRLASSLPRSTVDGTIRLGEADLPRTLDTLRAAGLADVAPDAVTRGTIAGVVTVAGTIDTPRLHVTGAARDLATGRWTGIDTDFTAEGTVDRLDVEARIQHADSRNTGEIAGTMWPTARRVETRVTATLRDLPAALADPSIFGTVALDFTATGPFDQLQATGTAAVTDARYDTFEIGALDAAFDVDADRIGVDVAAPELNARATARLPRAENAPAVIDVRVVDGDVARVMRSAASPVDVSGRISLNARAEGPLTDWRRGQAAVEVTALDVRAGDLPVMLSAPARASYDGAVFTVRELEASVGDTRLSVAGSLPLSTNTNIEAADALRGLLSGDAAQVLTAASATGLMAVPPGLAITGPVALLARVTGSVERPVVAADFDFTGGVALPDIPPATDVQVRVQVADGWIDLLSATARWQDASATAAGRLPLQLLDAYLPENVLRVLPAAAGNATFTARAEGITPSVLSPFVDQATLSQIEGLVDAVVRLDAPALDLAAIRGEVRLDRLEMRLAGLPIAQQEPTRVAVGDGIARVAAWNWSGQGANLTVQGDVRLADRRAALLAAGRIDLRTLAPFLGSTGVALSGTLEPRVSITGALDDPGIDGELSLRDGELRLRDPRIVATDVNAFAVMTPTGGRTTSMSGTVNGGALTGDATLQYGGASPWRLQLRTAIAGMGLEFPEGLRSELDLDLALAMGSAPAGPEGSVTGTVTVVRGSYREPIAVATGLLAGLRANRLAPGGAGQGSLAERLELNVRVITDNDLVVDNNLARLELGGDLRVIGTAAAPSLSGRAELREGGQLILGQNVYTVDVGTIDFANPVTIEPNLNVQARTRAAGYDIELTLTGTPETLDVGLSAPGSDLGEADVASILLTGRPLSEVPGAEARIVGEQVVGYLSGDVLGFAGRALGLDTFRLGGPSNVRRDPAAVAAEADPTSRLTFGKAFGDNVEVTFSQSLRESVSTWIVDYQPLPQVDVRLVSGDDNLRTYELRHNVSIGGAPDTRRRRGGDSVVRIAAVTFTGDSPLPEPRLRDVTGLQDGGRFDLAEWLGARDRLEAALRGEGYFEARVVATRDESPGAVGLRFDIQSGPKTLIVVNGHTLDARVLAALENAWTQSVFDDFLRDEAAAIVRDALAADGFVQADVSTAMTTAAGTKTLLIAIVPGTRAGDRRVSITADDEALARDMSEWLAERQLEEVAWRDPQAVLAALTEALRGRGYLNARVAAAEPVVDGARATLPIAIDAGARFTLGAIVLPDAGPLDPDELRQAAGLDPGAPYDPPSMVAATERLARAYRREGFAAARVEVQPRIDEATHSVAIAFAVARGPRDVLRRVEIRGNRSVDEDVITRVLQLQVGEPLGTEAWLQARSRLFETSLFRRVDVSAEPLAEAPGAGAPAEERPMRVVVAVQEWPALRLRYGVQVSEERPEAEVDGRELAPGFSADVTRRTLFGRALTTGAAVEYQRRERLGRIFANAPTLAGLPIESLLTLQMSRETFTESELVTSRRGISWEQRVRVGAPLRLSYSYTFERNRTYATGPPDPIFGVFDITVAVARLATAAVFDTRDDPTDTTTGSLFSSTLEHAPPTLGSDVRFVRQVTQAYRFQPWRRVVFASAARVGLATPLGGQVLIPSERFYAGGARTVRGVAEDSLGPLDFDGAPSGGEALVVLNQEVRFPIAGRVRGVGFLDAGMVYERPSAIDLSQLVVSTGAGLRVNTPIGLLRVDFARPVRGVSGESGRWMFGIGHAF